MRGLLSVVGLGFLALGLGCSGGADVVPPPPPPPEGVVPPVEVPPVVPPVEPAPAPTLLPPPWAELGLGYAGTSVLLIEPASAVLVTTSVAAADAQKLFASWQASLLAAGFQGGAAVATGDDTTQDWVMGDRRIAIAHGIVDTTAYVMAEDVQQLPDGAIAARTTDGAVRLLLTARSAAPGAEPTSTTGKPPITELPGKNHGFSPAKDKGKAFPMGKEGREGKEGKGGGKKPGPKAKDKKSE